MKRCEICGRKFDGDVCSCQRIGGKSEGIRGYAAFGITLISISVVAALFTVAINPVLAGVAAAIALGGIVTGVLFMALGRIIALLKEISFKIK